jgi:hypothetical protein
MKLKDARWIFMSRGQRKLISERKFQTKHRKIVSCQTSLKIFGGISNRRITAKNNWKKSVFLFWIDTPKCEIEIRTFPFHLILIFMSLLSRSLKSQTSESFKKRMYRQYNFFVWMSCSVPEMNHAV